MQASSEAIAMETQSVTVQGIVLPNGSLQIVGPVQLPPGPVEITIRPAEQVEGGEDVLAVLARIRVEQNASGFVPRSAEEIDASVREMRDEWEERQVAIEMLQEECRRQRQASPPSGKASS